MADDELERRVQERLDELYRSWERQGVEYPPDVRKSTEDSVRSLVAFEMHHESAVRQVEEILRSHEIRMAVWACGCCESPKVSFEYKGKMIVDNVVNFSFDMIDPSDDASDDD